MKWVYFDNKILTKGHGRISGLAEGLLIGQGLFETMRCYDGKVFALDKHLKRLLESCPVLRIKRPSLKDLKKAVLCVVEKNRLTNAYIRLNVFKNGEDSSIFVFAKRLSLPGPVKYKRGFSVTLFRDERIGLSPLNNVKSLNHYFYSRLSRMAADLGFDEAVFMNARGEIVEGSKTNIFLVKGNKVSTPEITSGCLPGITRAIAIECLKRSGFSVRERKILPGELYSQDEIFVTNSLIGIMPVTRLDNKPVGSGRPGVITQEIMNVYKNEVEKECILR